MILILANHICSTPASAINIVCPHYQGFQDRAKKEQHIIYNVKEINLKIKITKHQSLSSSGGGIPVLQDREALTKDDRQVHRAKREKASVNDAAADI